MTKRLTPEEDSQAIEGIRSRSGYDQITDDETVTHRIDKGKVEMEITREGERFLEVRFKRKESADAGKGVAFDEVAQWPSGSSGTCICEICQRNRAIKISEVPNPYAEARAAAERLLKANGR